jgi:hypothetical protein
VFFDHHAKPPKHHPIERRRDMPDILAAWFRNFERWSKGKFEQLKCYSDFPWHLIESVIEEKGLVDGYKIEQVVAYAGSLRQARPDKPGVYALHTRPTGYKVVWDDPAGAITTPYISWDEPIALIYYVNSLYSPPAQHYSSDPSVRLYNNNVYGDEEPKWEADDIGGPYESIFVGSAHSRMPRVHKKEGDEIRFWKDSYRDSGRRFEELEILRKIHKERIIPGVVQFNDELSGDVKIGENSITTAKDNAVRNETNLRIKTRLVMESTGEELSKCSTVLEGLKVLFDILEGLLCSLRLCQLC